MVWGLKTVLSLITAGKQVRYSRSVRSFQCDLHIDLKEELKENSRQNKTIMQKVSASFFYISRVLTSLLCRLKMVSEGDRPHK